MLEAKPGWSIDVDRGPDWLFVRLHADRGDCGEVSGLAETLWEILQRHFSHRLVVEMEEVRWLRSSLVGELVRLHKRIASHGGLLRLSGLSDQNQEVLRHCRLAGCFPQYHSAPKRSRANGRTSLASRSVEVAGVLGSGRASASTRRRTPWLPRPDWHAARRPESGPVGSSPAGPVARVQPSGTYSQLTSSWLSMRCTPSTCRTASWAICF